MIVRSSTDLPVPEPPTSPTTSPRQTSRSRSSWTTLVAELVRTSRSFSTTPAVAMIDELAAFAVWRLRGHTSRRPAGR